MKAQREESMEEKNKKEKPQREYGYKYHIFNTQKHQAIANPQNNKELVGANPEKRNWKGIIIAILVILLVFACIAIAVWIVSPDAYEKSDKELGATFTFEDLYDPSFQSKSFDAQWLTDRDAFVYRSREGEILLYDANNHTTSILMDNSTFRLYDTETYFVSPDLQFVMIAYKIEQVYRHSFLARYGIYNRHASDQSMRPIKFPYESNEENEWEERKLQFAGWSNSGHSLTFVYGNNIYYQKDPFQRPVQLTLTGGVDIYNGIPDWLYEEEILDSNVAQWWNNDSTFLLYTEINDTLVPKYKFPWYGDNLYGGFRNISYPKAGDITEDINPKIKLWVHKFGENATSHKELLPPEEFRDSEYYITRLRWQDTTHALVAWSNRAQNFSIVTVCDVQTAECHQNINEKSKTGWVTIDDFLFINEGSQYLTTLPALEGDQGYWKHIAMVTAPNDKNGIVTFVTQGVFEVLNILGYQESTKTVFYTGTNGDLRSRHIFNVKIPTANENLHAPQCITCNMGKKCQYVDGVFSSSGNLYILHCLGPEVPQYLLRSTVNKTYNKIFEDNKELANKIKNTALPVEKYFDIKTKDGGNISVKMLLPRVLNTEHLTRFPLLLDTYAGPDSQIATYEFHIGWETYLTSAANIIYAMADGHGSAGKGQRWRHSIYKRLGTLEVQDQIRAAEFIRDKFKFVDVERIGIWGMSYGGFVAAHALGDERSDVFSCAVAVAPVVDFRYYDTAYTERYMGFANRNNIPAYEAANVRNKAHYMKGKDFMIVHGTADENVHFQHTAQLVKALVDAEVDFRIQAYSDLGHPFPRQQESRHLYQTMTNFIRESCWDGAKPRELRDDNVYVEVDVALLAIL